MSSPWSPARPGSGSRWTSRRSPRPRSTWAKPMSLKAGQIAARDALAEVLGSVGLSYRITEDATLFITTAARLASETGKKAVIEGPPIKLTLGQPVKPGDPSFRELTRDAYARRLALAGDAGRSRADRTSTSTGRPCSSRRG